MMKMNEQDKNQMLNKVLSEGEMYSAKVWGTIMAGAETMTAIGVAGGVLGNLFGAVATGAAGASGALTNEYCYVGLTNSRLVFCVVGKINCSKLKTCFAINLNEITKVKIKKSLIPGRRVLKIYVEKKCIKLSLVNNTIATDLQGQKEGMETIIDKLSEYK